jgi:hypothetical protein
MARAHRTQRPYIRIDQSLGDHKKAMLLAPRHYLAALGLHVLGIGLSDRLHSDGFLPDASLDKIALGSTTGALKELVRVGLWEKVEGGYQIHDYLDWQDSSEEISAKKEQATTAANRRWGKTDGADSTSTPDANRNAERITNRNATSGEVSMPRTRAHAGVPNQTIPNQSNPIPPSPSLAGDDDCSSDPPKAVERFIGLVRVWEGAVGSVPSEATKRTIRAWASMGYSDAAVAAALALAVEKQAGSPADYATTCLRNAKPGAGVDDAEDARLVEKYGGGATC